MTFSFNYPLVEWSGGGCPKTFNFRIYKLLILNLHNKQILWSWNLDTVFFELFGRKSIQKQQQYYKSYIYNEVRMPSKKVLG